jgi:hypothetical protein
MKKINIIFKIIISTLIIGLCSGQWILGAFFCAGIALSKNLVNRNKL